MSYRDIMVHLDNTPACPARLEAAIDLVQRFDARLTGFFVLADPNVQGTGSREGRRFVIESAREGEDLFRSRVSASGIDAEWFSIVTPSDHQVSDEVLVGARHADLCVMGQFDASTADGGLRSDMVETTVQNAGRPIMVMPYAGRFDTLGERIVVAWNGGREAARALADAIPFLSGAKHVTVVSLNPADQPKMRIEAPFADVGRFLEAHGIRTSDYRLDQLVFDAHDIGPADRLLSYLTDEAADLLVMGAFGNYGFPNFARGRLTPHVLSAMTVPVLMSH